MSDALLEIIRGRLAELPHHQGPEWNLWQRKTFNIHRGVLEWSPRQPPSSLDELRDSVREVVRTEYRPSWWRGFGFGVLLHLRELPSSPADFTQLIDVRNNRRGTWQWLVLTIENARAAVGIRTWTEGYLSPVFNELIVGFDSQGWKHAVVQKDPDAFTQALLNIAKLTS